MSRCVERKYKTDNTTWMGQDCKSKRVSLSHCRCTTGKIVCRDKRIDVQCSA